MNVISKGGNLGQVIKATSYVVTPQLSSKLPIPADIPKELFVKDITHHPIGVYGLNVFAIGGKVKATSGLSGATQYRFIYSTPDFSEYRKKSTSDPTLSSRETAERRRILPYLAAGSCGVVSYMTVKESIRKFLWYFWLNQDALAAGSTEVDLSGIQEGKNITVEWRGKPVFIKHRSQNEQDVVRDESELALLRDPEKDEARTQKPEWLVVIGVCTHLGCIPLANKGNHVGGYFCPCHGSHYDASGRIREGPAPTNLEVPPYKFIDDKTILIGD